jgi:hypothetical protein
MRISIMAQLLAEQLEDRLLLSASLPIDDWSETLARAAEVALSSAGYARMDPSLQPNGPADTFRFVAPYTGEIQVENHVGANSNLKTELHLFDESGQPILPENFYRAGSNSVASFEVEAGQSYIVKALAAPPIDSLLPPPPSIDDSFELYFGPADDAGSRANSAVTLPPALGLLRGRIEVPSDVDRYLLVPDQHGQLRIEWNLPDAAGIRLRVLDANDNPMVPTGLSTAGLLEFAVAAREVYYLQMNAAVHWPGALAVGTYELMLTLIPSAQFSATPRTMTVPTESNLSSGDITSTFTLASSGSFDTTDLSRFLDGGDESLTVTGVLALPESGLALVGAILSGMSDSLETLSAYFGSGSMPPSEVSTEEPVPESESGVVRTNFKIGVEEALRSRLSEAHAQWLRSDSSTDQREEGTADETVPLLSGVLAAELTRLGQGLSDITMSLLRRMAQVNQSLWFAEPASEQPPQESGTEKEAIPGDRPQSRLDSPTLSISGWQVGMALLLSLSMLQLNATQRHLFTPEYRGRGRK